MVVIIVAMVLLLLLLIWKYTHGILSTTINTLLETESCNVKEVVMVTYSSRLLPVSHCQSISFTLLFHSSVTILLHPGPFPMASHRLSYLCRNCGFEVVSVTPCKPVNATLLAAGANITLGNEPRRRWNASSTATSFSFSFLIPEREIYQNFIVSIILVIKIWISRSFIPLRFLKSKRYCL